MELSKRKPNRLSEYDYSTNGAYFVTICTQDRRKILSDIVGDDAHIVPKPCGLAAAPKAPLCKGSWIFLCVSEEKD